MALPVIPEVPEQSIHLEDGSKDTYSASITALAAAASATDLFTISGSATKIVRVTRLRLSGIKTTAGADIDVRLIKRSAANTAGTSTSPTLVPHDSGSPAATAAVKAYTVNPTSVGAAVGDVASDKVYVGLATESTHVREYKFGEGSEKAVVLRGVAELLAVSLNTVTVGGGAFDISCTVTEEPL